MLILGGMSLHALVGALLLQPIKWHAKPVKEDVQNDTSKKGKLIAAILLINRK